MTFWTFLDRTLNRLPGWPSERQWVTIWLGALIVILLLMARANPDLWNVEVFKVIAQAVVLTGFLNMVLAFHFAANKGDEDKTANTGKAFEAITAAANAAAPGEVASKAADQVADAAADKASQIKGDAA
jgi:hypothetical protein